MFTRGRHTRMESSGKMAATTTARALMLPADTSAQSGQFCFVCWLVNGRIRIMLLGNRNIH